MPPIMAVVMAVGFWNPTVKEGAIVSSGLMERPWARYSGDVTGSYNCSGSLSDNYGFVGAVPAGRSIWEYIYPSLQYHYDDSPYIVVQSSQGGKRVYMCSTDPTTSTDNTTVIADATDIYWRCNSGTTYSPTSLGPTPAPTLNPTLAPTTGDEDEFYALYGPSSEAECDDNGGFNWNGGILYDDVDRDAPDAYVINMTYGNTVVRYCCGVPACVGSFYHNDPYDRVTVGCACNPTPWEVQVRNNGGPCYFCPASVPYPELVYCEDTPQCNLQTPSWCIEGGRMGCPPYATSNPPTVAPTPRLEAPPCWTYESGICTSDPSPTAWCTGDKFYFDYIVHPRPGMETQRAATVEDFEALSTPNKQGMSEVVEGLVSDAMQDRKTCWCPEQNTQWLPYGIVQTVEVENATGFSSKGVPVPLPRYLLQGIEKPGSMYMRTLTTDISAFAFIENVSGTLSFSMATDLAGTYNEDLAPDTTSCNRLSCTTLDYEAQNPEFFPCRFVCINIFYAPSNPWAPVSVTWLKDVTEESQCSKNSMWINARALKPMLLQEHWQSYLDGVRYTEHFYQSVPWLNFSKEDPSWSDDTNCKLTSTSYCGIAGNGYGDYLDWWCGPESLNGLQDDPDLYALYTMVDFVGIAGLSPALNTMTCGDTPSYPPLNKIIPNITLPGGTPTIAEEWRQSVRTQLNGLFWKVLLGYNADDCSGTATFEIVHADTFEVTVDLEWYTIGDTEGCIGMPGCDALGQEDCSGDIDIPGCSFRSSTTVASTTATIGTDTNFGTFAPSFPGPPTQEVKAGFDRADHNATYAVASIAVVVVFVLVLVAVFTRGGEDEGGDLEEHEPFMMG